MQLPQQQQHIHTHSSSSNTHSSSNSCNCDSDSNISMHLLVMSSLRGSSSEHTYSAQCPRCMPTHTHTHTRVYIELYMCFLCVAGLPLKTKAQLLSAIASRIFGCVFFLCFCVYLFTPASSFIINNQRILFMLLYAAAPPPPAASLPRLSWGRKGREEVVGGASEVSNV